MKGINGKQVSRGTRASTTTRMYGASTGEQIRKEAVRVNRFHVLGGNVVPQVPLQSRKVSLCNCFIDPTRPPRKVIGAKSHSVWI